MLWHRSWVSSFILTRDHFFMMFIPVEVNALRASWSSLLRIIKSGLFSQEGDVDSSHLILRLLGILLSVWSLWALSFFCSMTDVKLRQVEPRYLMWFSRAVCCNKMTVRSGSKSGVRLIWRFELLAACFFWDRKGLMRLFFVMTFVAFFKVWSLLLLSWVKL